MDNYLVDCVRILRTPTVGPVTYNLLKIKYKTPQAIIEALQSNGVVVVDPITAQKEIDDHNSHGSILVEQDMDEYPKRLQPYSKTFPLISIKGNQSLLDQRTIGMVGARQCTVVGRQYTKVLTQKLREKYATVSGLAVGIDTVVAENSLGQHIGVVPGGINVVYPPSAAGLYDAIIKSGGCLISCQPFNGEPKKYLFPLRNQLIGALSDGLIITEAKIKSGSLQTAQFVLDYNKPLLVVPSHPMDDNYSGNNLLLKNPQVIAMDHNVDLDKILDKSWRLFDDYWPSVAPSIDIKVTHPTIKKDIMAMVSLVPLDINHLAHYLNQPLGLVVSSCIQLELEGKIVIDGGMKIIKNIPFNFFDENI